MDRNTQGSAPGAQQSPELRNQQQLQNNGLSYPVPNQYPPGDEYNSFYENAFTNAWATPPIVDAQAYLQNADAWSPGPQGQPIQTTNFSHGYHAANPPAASPYNYPSGFNNAPYQTYPVNGLDSSISYGGDSLIHQDSFSQVPQPGFVNPSGAVSGGTVSPSVLQSFPNGYGSETQTPPPPPTAAAPAPAAATPVSDSPQPPKPTRKASNPDSLDPVSSVFAEKIPAARKSGAMSLIDVAELLSVIEGEMMTDSLYVALEEQYSKEPRVVFPTVVPRRSVKQLKLEAIRRQAGRPWDKFSPAVMKKMKLKSLATGRTPKPTMSSSAALPRTGAAVTTAAAAPPSESSSEEESEDEDSDDDDDEEPSPLPPSRPTDAGKAAEYDLVKAIWFNRTSTLSAAAIREALGDFWNVLKALRETSKATAAELLKAQEKKDTASENKLKERAIKQRQTMENVMALTKKHGHDDIIERLGEIPALMAFFYSLLADRVKESDYTAPLIGHVLELISVGTTVDRAMLERAKLDKILARLLKKGSDEVKSLAQQILDNTAKVTKQKELESKDSEAAEPAKKTAAQPARAEPVIGVKRPLAGETATSRAIKKPAPSALSKPGATSIKAGSSATSKATAAKVVPAGKSDAKQASTASAAAQVKVKQIVPKPSSYLSTLGSASKKPGTSIAAQKAGQASEIKVKAIDTQSKAVQPTESKPVAPVAPTPKPAFSFSQTLANLGKPKVVETAKQAVDTGPPETKEEKAKRLRKEARRKLRVSWKPEGSLEEVRLFHHDPDEELGHDDNMIRDVDDIKNEGRMLKMHKEREAEDEEDDGSQAEDLAPWKPPIAIDFSDNDYDQSVSNSETRGGGTVKVNSPEKEVQEQRERRTLVQIYTPENPVPPSPREPVDHYAGVDKPLREFGRPKPETRAREQVYYAQMQMPHGSGASTGLAPNISQLLAKLSSQAPAAAAQQYQASHQQQQYQAAPAAVPLQQYQAPAAQASGAPVPDLTNLEAIFARFATKPAPPPPPPVQQQQQVLDSSIQNALAIFNQQQQQQVAPQLQAQYNPGPAATSAAAAPVNINALLAQLGQQQLAGNQAVVSNQGQGQGQGQAQEYQNQGQSQGQNQNQYGQGNDRKRQWATSEDPYDDSKRAKGNNNNNDSKNAWADNDYNNNGNNNNGNGNNSNGNSNNSSGGNNSGSKKPWNGIPSVQCKYWLEGKCKKGKNCTFRHDYE